MGAEDIRKLNEKMGYNPDVEMGLRLDQLIAAHNQQRATIVELVTLANELKADLNAVTAKLDGDTGITDTNYGSLHTTAASDATALALAAITRI